MKEEGESSQNVKPRSKRNSVASASASASATPVGRFRRRAARSPFSTSNCCCQTASSLVCAQRGWVGVDLDKIQCEYYGSSLHYSPPQNALNHPEADSNEEEFSKQLDVAHESSCPWVGNCCPESLVQFPPTPPSVLIGGYKDRCDGLLQFYSLPIVSVSAINQMSASRGPQIDRLLALLQVYANDDPSFRMGNISATETSKEEALSNYARAQKLISLCGWKPRWLPNIQDSSGNYEVLGPEYKSESISPLLDCSLCGVTIRIWDFLTTSRPVPLAPINSNLPETSKKMGVTRGTSETSGINGWFANEDMEQQHNEDVDEAETSVKRRLVSNTVIEERKLCEGNLQEVRLVIVLLHMNHEGQVLVKRNLEDGGSTADRPPYLRIQHADSVEGSVVDRDGDEVNDDSAGPSKRTRGSEVQETCLPFYGRDLSVGGPSHSVEAENEREVNRSEGNEQAVAFPGARDSACASSVIAMDTICHSANDDSMESVENRPRDFDDVNYPSVATAQSADLNEPSELNLSNQAQQSACFQQAPVRSNAEQGISSINDGDEVLDTETVTAQGRDGPSLGVSGGSVGMGAIHEAEIHGADVSVHRGDSVVGSMEPVVEVIEDLGEFAPDQGVLMILFLKKWIEKIGLGIVKIGCLNPLQGRTCSPITVLQCDCVSGFEASKEEVTQTWNESPLNAGFALPGSSYTANGQGPPNGDSNDEIVEFDPIKYHNSTALG
ncbi:hypothetical protein DY000_02054985 [Brassica cretica]|uniref:C3HC-type domain-containing protein n=1 Tax=Brassica cretica TaxID=69181 RepID=A0ABQ7ANF5_BRACR|nr:hypothetical protein DY000_02054985 [Brassica cretica]